MNIQHGNSWTGENVSGWHCSQKMDGWRAVWNGSELLTRTGNEYAAPEWFTRDLPATLLDCELWLGRGKNCDDVHRAVLANEWHRLKLVAFDIPQVGLSIEGAIRLLQSLKLPSHASAIEYNRAESTDHAVRLMREIVNAKGEGLVVRKPRTVYQPFRNSNLLKMKP